MLFSLINITYLFSCFNNETNFTINSEIHSATILIVQNNAKDLELIFEDVPPNMCVRDILIRKKMLLHFMLFL